jgi:lipooligosaccharide transport system permease protein
VRTGLAFGAPIMAYAAVLRPGGNFNAVFRFIITPLFLFSGVFFPVSQLPPAVQTLARMTPLYHGVELTRGIALETLSWPDAAWHLAFLAALTAGGAVVAVRAFSSKLRA